MSNCEEPCGKRDEARYEVPFEVGETTYEDALALLRGALRFGIEPLLESVSDMLSELGRPDGRFRILQIAGTNGKTSTARYTAAILAGEGLSTALYTSPELVNYTERMEVAGAPVSEAAFAHGIAAAAEAGLRVNSARAEAGERPYDITEFDLLTVGAMVVFAEASVDVAVLECGMGGRWDATSATSPEAVAITGIGLDHMRILGDTLEAIAGEKAAIIKPGRSCVLGVGTATPASVEDVFLDQCAGAGVTPVLLRPEKLEDAPGELAPGEIRSHPELPHASYVVTRRPQAIGDSLVLDVTTPRATYQDLYAVRPVYQAANIACAVALSEAFLGRALDEYRLAENIAGCPTPGRFNVLSGRPIHLIDAAHNPQSIDTFLSSLREIEPEVARRPQLLCAVLADKDVAGIVALLAREFPAVSVTQTGSPRALPAAQLAATFEAEGVVPQAVYPTVGEAVAALDQVDYVAVGSITLAGEVAAALR